MGNPPPPRRPRIFQSFDGFEDEDEVEPGSAAFQTASKGSRKVPHKDAIENPAERVMVLFNLPIDKAKDAIKMAVNNPFTQARNPCQQAASSEAR